MTEQTQSIDISTRLREIMLASKLSVAQIAGHAGVSKSAMEKYLSGPSSPRATAILNICNSPDVDPGWLLKGDINRERHDEAMSMTLSSFNVIHELLKEMRSDPSFRNRVLIEATEDAVRDMAYVYGKRVLNTFTDMKDATTVYGEPMPIYPDSKK